MLTRTKNTQFSLFSAPSKLLEIDHLINKTGLYSHEIYNPMGQQDITISRINC